MPGTKRGPSEVDGDIGIENSKDNYQLSSISDANHSTEKQKIEGSIQDAMASDLELQQNSTYNFTGTSQVSSLGGTTSGTTSIQVPNDANQTTFSTDNNTKDSIQDTTSGDEVGRSEIGHHGSKTVELVANDQHGSSESGSSDRDEDSANISSDGSESSDGTSDVDTEAFDSDGDDSSDLGIEDVDAHAEPKAALMKKMTLERAEWEFMAAKAAYDAYVCVANEGEGINLLRKEAFARRKADAKLMSRKILEAEYAEMLEEIDTRFRDSSKRSIEFEESAKAYYYVLDDEVGEERVRKEVFRAKKREALKLYKVDFDLVIDNLEKLEAEVKAYGPILEKKRGRKARDIASAHEASSAGPNAADLEVMMMKSDATNL